MVSVFPSAILATINSNLDTWMTNRSWNFVVHN